MSSVREMFFGEHGMTKGECLEARYDLFLKSRDGIIRNANTSKESHKADLVVFQLDLRDITARQIARLVGFDNDQQLELIRRTVPHKVAPLLMLGSPRSGVTDFPETFPDAVCIDGPAGTGMFWCVVVAFSGMYFTKLHFKESP